MIEAATCSAEVAQYWATAIGFPLGLFAVLGGIALVVKAANK